MEFSAKHIAIDFETQPIAFFERTKKAYDFTGHPRFAKPFLVSASTEDRKHITRNLETFAVEPGRTAVFHNAAFDIAAGANAGLWRECDLLKFHCTSVMARLSDNLRPHGLKALASQLLGKQVVLYAEASAGSAQAFDEYALNDAVFAFELFPVLRDELVIKNLWRLYDEVERPFILVNLECQKNGFTFDQASATAERARLFAVSSKIKQELGDESINWNSPKQLQRKLFGEFNLQLVYHKGKISTNKQALKMISSDERVRKVLELKVAKSLGSQINGLAKFVDPSTSKIHPYINSLGADTGRSTSSKPNLQNIEKKSILRRLFVASPGHKLIVIDFSQIEPRVLAHFIPQTEFSSIFGSDHDFYEAVTTRLNLISDGKRLSRDVAKMVVIATLYGMGAKTLSESLKVSHAEGEQVLARFQIAFPQIGGFRDEQVALARSRGFTCGLLGRRRYIEHLNSSDLKARSRAERQVLNSIVQGSAATIFKAKLVELRRRLPSEVRFLHHVHDEIILEAPSERCDQYFDEAVRILEGEVDFFSVPLKVEGGIGNSWFEAKQNPKERR